MIPELNDGSRWWVATYRDQKSFPVKDQNLVYWYDFYGYRIETEKQYNKRMKNEG